MSKPDFIEELMSSILEGTKIPKVQVERAISPIIGYFIGPLLTKCFDSDDKLKGEYELISPEFPLKKENNQSTNIDYLLINHGKKSLVFLELKTDVSSFNKIQAGKYIDYKKRVNENTGAILYEELLEIEEASIRKYKYQYVAGKCRDHVDIMKQTYKLIIIYLVPEPIKGMIENIRGIDKVITFNELPMDIDHRFTTHWTKIRECLTKLDIIDNGQIPEEDISYSNIIENVDKLNTNKRPLGIRLGNTGKGYRPNYQIRFDDGSVEAFFNNGNRAQVSGFNSRNLSREYSWEKFVRQVSEYNIANSDNPSF